MVPISLLCAVLTIGVVLFQPRAASAQLTTVFLDQPPINSQISGWEVEYDPSHVTIEPDSTMATGHPGLRITASYDPQHTTADIRFIPHGFATDHLRASMRIVAANFSLNRWNGFDISLASTFVPNNNADLTNEHPHYAHLHADYDPNLVDYSSAFAQATAVILTDVLGNVAQTGLHYTVATHTITAVHVVQKVAVGVPAPETDWNGIGLHAFADDGNPFLLHLAPTWVCDRNNQEVCITP